MATKKTARASASRKTAKGNASTKKPAVDPLIAAASTPSVKTAFRAASQGTLTVRQRNAKLVAELIAAWPHKTKQPWTARWTPKALYIGATGKAPGATEKLPPKEAAIYANHGLCTRTANAKLVEAGKLAPKPPRENGKPEVHGKAKASRNRRPGTLAAATPDLAREVMAKRPKAHAIALKLAGLLRGSAILREVAQELVALADTRELAKSA